MNSTYARASSARVTDLLVPFASLTEPTPLVDAWRRFTARMARISASIARAWAIRRTVAAFSELDAETLEDIGVERYDLRFVAEIVVDNPSAGFRALWRV